MPIHWILPNPCQWMGCQAGEGNLWISHYLHSHWSFLDALGPQPNSIFPLVHFNDHFISSQFILSLWLNPRLISFTFQCEILPFWLYFNSNFNFPWPIPFQFEIQSPLLIFKAVSPSFNLSIKGPLIFSLQFEKSEILSECQKLWEIGFDSFSKPEHLSS